MKYYVVWSPAEGIGVVLSAYSEENALVEGTVALAKAGDSLDHLEIKRLSVPRLEKVFGKDSLAWYYLGDGDKEGWVFSTGKELEALIK